MSKMGLTRKQTVMVVLMIVGTFVAVLNQTIVTPALPSIMADTGVDTATVQWLTTGFTLVNAIMIPVTAFLTDRFSLKWLFVTALAIFMAGTVVCAWGPNFPILLTGRLVQAVGAGIMQPLVMIVLLQTFPIEKRGTAMGIFGTVIAFAPAVGPTVSGIVVDHAGWHVMFWAIVVMSAIVVIASIFLLDHSDAANPNAQLDIPSVVLSSLGFGSLLYGLSSIGSYGLSLASMLWIAVGVVILIFFFRRQLKLDEPMLNVRVLSNKRFLISTIIVMLVQASLIAATILLPIYMQSDLGLSATMSGLVLLPASLIMAVLNPIAGSLFDKHGPRILSIIGMGALTVTTFLFSGLGTQTSVLWLMLLYALRMTSMTLVNMPVNTWGMNALDAKLVNHGTSVNNTFRQVAGSLGTAVIVSISTMITNSQIAAGSDEILANIHGTNVAFMISGAVCVVGFILCVLFVKNKPKKLTEMSPEILGHPDVLEAIIRKDVYTIPQSATVLDAMKVLVEKGISAAPLVDANGHPVGFISDGDILRALSRRSEIVTDPISMITVMVGDRAESREFVEKSEELLAAPVSAVAVNKVITANLQDSLTDVCRLFGSTHLKKIPVLDDDGRLAGIINRSNIIKYTMKLNIEHAKTESKAKDGE